MLAVPKFTNKSVFFLLAAVLASLALCSCESRPVKPTPMIQEGAPSEATALPAALLQASLEADSEKVPAGTIIRQPAGTSSHVASANR